jgi:hypothetical protein
MIGIEFPATVIALMDVASKVRRSAVLNIGQCLLLDSRQPMSPFLPKRFAVEADDIGQLRHEELEIRVPA